MMQRWRFLIGALAALAWAGCSSADKHEDVLAQALGGPEIETVSYHTDADPPPRKVKDPLTLKLRYARWMEESGHLQEARRHYTAVLEKKPKHIEALLGMARIDERTGRIQAAEERFRRALELSPTSPQAKYEAGRFYAEQQRWPEAIALLNQATLADPANGPCRYQLAISLAQAGYVSEALPHFQRTVGDAAAHFNIAMILKDQGRLAEAEQQLLTAVSKDPRLSQAQHWLDEIRRQQQSNWLQAEQGRTAPASMSSNIATAGHSTIEPMPYSIERTTAPPPSTRKLPSRSTGRMTPAQLEQLRNQTSYAH